MKFNWIIVFALLLGQVMVSQNKFERKSKVDLEDFPEKAYALLQPHIENARRIRLYKEVDGTKQSYEVKFKKRKLHYSVEFDARGNLEDVEFNIKAVDIPEDSWKAIQKYLKSNYSDYEIKTMLQQYAMQADVSEEQLLYNAFQNLILPDVQYVLEFTSKKSGKKQLIVGHFNSDGSLILIQ